MNPADWIGRPIADVDGEPYGTLDELFVGKTTGEPEFAFVSVSGKRVAVPLRNARRADDIVVLPLDPDRVREAPAVKREVTSIPAEAGERVLEFFGLTGPTALPPTAPTTPLRPMPPAAPTPVADPDPDEVEVTVSEEELVVDKASHATERVRLRKEIVEEEVTLTVTLRREELRIEREPIGAGTDVERGNGDAQLTDGELEFVLYAEEPVVQKRVVPVERVKVARDTIVEHARLTDQVRKERVEVDTTPTEETTDR